MLFGYLKRQRNEDGPEPYYVNQRPHELMSKAEEFIEHVFRAEWMDSEDWAEMLTEIGVQYPNLYTETSLAIIESEIDGLTFEQIKAIGKEQRDQLDFEHGN